MCEFCEESIAKIVDSVEALNKYMTTAAVKISYHNDYGHITFLAPSEESVIDMDGARAVAWLENNLLCNLRVPHGKHRIARIKNAARDTEDWHNIAAHYRPGHIPLAPLTGWYTDGIVLNSIIDSVRKGHSLGDAFGRRLTGDIDTFVELTVEYNHVDECGEDK